MQASAWKHVLKILLELEVHGLDDDKVKQSLSSNDAIRSRYLVVHELVKVLVNLNQQNVSVLATTTRAHPFSHSQKYFLNLIFQRTIKTTSK